MFWVMITSIASENLCKPTFLITGRDDYTLPVALLASVFPRSFNLVVGFNTLMNYRLYDRILNTFDVVVVDDLFGCLFSKL